MDLIYMTDVMAYQAMRGPSYKYSWSQPEQNSSPPKNQMFQKKNNVKEPCKICQEKQRRSLMKYIRTKSQDHSGNKIKEEEEEEEEECQEEVGQKEQRNS
uniref:Uncharacterized protein n=1 Tax=Cuerna arida TaxID=1464854 RepID=A0A1B6FMS0_9HEMI